MSIGNAFNESVEYYDNWVKIAIPCFDEVFSIAQELIPFDARASLDVLDLGAGTGLFSSFVSKNYPQARFVLIDLADKMLNLARQRFASRGKAFEYICSDYLQHDFEKGRSFDLVISSLSIHHLSHINKQTLFKRIYGLLKPKGLFINLDQIRGETDFLQSLYWKQWLKKVRVRGGTEEQINSSIKRREEFDKDATYLEQINWLKQAGFNNVDCIYRNYFIGLFAAHKEKL